MAKLILLLIFMLPNLLLDAQVVGTHASGARQKTFFEQAFTIGGANEERSRRIITLSDGGYLIVGGTQSDGAGDFDALLVKLKPNGQIDWAKTIGGTDWDYFKGAIEAGGAIYAYGETYSGDAGGGDAFIAKLNLTTGAIIWDRVIGGSADYDQFYDAAEAGDGNIVFAGQTYSDGAGGADAFIVKVNASTGAIIWDRTVGGSNDEWISGIVKTADDGFVLVGDTYSDGAGDEDAFVFKINSSGTVQWDKTLGGASYDWFERAVVVDDGNVIIAGNTWSIGQGLGDALVVKINPSTGAIIWSKVMGGSNEEWEEHITKTRDGNVVISGGAEVCGSWWEGHVFKLDQSDGSLIWSRIAGDCDNNNGVDSWFQAHTETSDGGILAFGDVWYYGAGDQDFYVVKMSPKGNIPGGHQWVENDTYGSTIANATGLTYANADTADTEANADTADTEANADSADTEAAATDADSVFYVVGPAPFSFTDQTNVALSSTINSNILQITGLKHPAQMWIQNGNYRICSDAACSSEVQTWTSSNRILIYNNQYLQIRRTSAGTNNTASTVSIWVGATKDVWSITTLP